MKLPVCCRVAVTGFGIGIYTLPVCHQRVVHSHEGDTDQKNPLDPYHYTQKRLDSGSGTLDMGARRFGTDVARFLQRDQYKGALSDLGLVSAPLTQKRHGLAEANTISFVETDGHIPILAVAAGLWLVVEAGMFASYANIPAQTLLNPEASEEEKALSLGGFAVGTVSPGGGYGTLAKTLAQRGRGAAGRGRALGQAVGGHQETVQWRVLLQRAHDGLHPQR